MSLSKPFRLQELPQLAFEHVLHQMYPMDLVQLSNIPSETLLNQIRAVPLALHCDLLAKEYMAYLKLTFRNGCTFEWYIRTSNGKSCYSSGYQEAETLSDSLKLYNSTNAPPDRIHSDLHHECYHGFVDYEGVPLFSRLLSRFPCPIRIFSMSFNQSEVVQKCIIDWTTVKKCEVLRFQCSRQNDFLYFVSHIEVTRKVEIDYTHLYTNLCRTDKPNFCNYRLKDYKELHLKGVKKFSGYALNCRSNHEHLSLEGADLKTEDIVQYLKSWQNGKHLQLKTFIFSNLHFEEDLTVIPDGLDLEYFMPGNTPDFVKCSNIYLDPTITADLAFKTVLLKNRDGQHATLVVSSCWLYFAVWDNEPVEIPNGHRMMFKDLSKDYPVYILRPEFPEVFQDEVEMQDAMNGLQTKRHRDNFFSFFASF